MEQFPSIFVQVYSWSIWYNGVLEKKIAIKNTTRVWIFHIILHLIRIRDYSKLKWYSQIFLRFSEIHSLVVGLDYQNWWKIFFLKYIHPVDGLSVIWKGHHFDLRSSFIFNEKIHEKITWCWWWDQSFVVHSKLFYT